MHKPHLERAYQIWKGLLKPSDVVIDATCGNGKDTQRLAELVPQGHVYAIDIQKDAIEKSRKNVTGSHVTFLHQCHTELPDVQPKLIVYNLGYLPGGCKQLTTQAATTLQSVQLASQRVVVGGALSLTCYPRHEEGEIEEKILQNWSQTLNREGWKVEYEFWKEKCPTLLMIYKLKTLF